MNAATASLINALALVGLGLWGYFSSDNPSVTAFIPVGIGVLLLLMNQGVRKENKAIAHVAVLLTLLILFGLVKPLMAAMGRSDNMAVFRVGTMIVTTVFAMIFFVKSFIDARKKRAS
ncbi:MAG: hypothetical protein AAF573_07040 [Bacteroidota bacterium]